jgi:hypothetical protein
MSLFKLLERHKNLKINNKMIGSNWNSKHKTKDQNKNTKINQIHEVCKTKVITNFYCNEIKKVNNKITKQGFLIINEFWVYYDLI